MDTSDKKFVWVIKNFSSLQSEEYYYSASFQIRDIKWRLAAYRNINSGESGDHLSLDLEVVDFESIPSGWTQYTEFRLTIVNQISNTYSLTRACRSWFGKEYWCCGVAQMISLNSLNAINGGFMVNGKIMIIVEVDAFAPIGIFDASQGKEISDDSEWTALDYPSSDEEDESSSEDEEDEEDEEDVIVEVNGFEVFQSQVDQVKEMFEKHEDLTLNFNLKSQYLKNAYMVVLLALNKTLNKSPKELTEKDLNKADMYSLLSDLTKAGFKVEWLCQKLDEKERACHTSNVLVRLRDFFFN